MRSGVYLLPGVYLLLPRYSTCFVILQLNVKLGIKWHGFLWIICP